MTKKIARRHVLLVEDIVDSGLTAQFLVSQLNKHKPASVAVCALLSKPANRQIEIEVQDVGFEVSQAYIVGYGLDFEQKYRNLPYLVSERKHRFFLQECFGNFPETSPRHPPPTHERLFSSSLHPRFWVGVLHRDVAIDS